MYYALNNPSQSGYLRKRFPKIIPFPRQVVFRFKVLFYKGNNSVPKFIFRLSRFPVYRGSGLGRFYCITTTNRVTRNLTREPQPKITRQNTSHQTHTTIHRKFTLTLNHPSLQKKTTDVVIQQHSRKLLMMYIQ